MNIISVIDDIDLDLNDLFCDKRPLNILIVGKEPLKKFMDKLDKFKDWVDVKSNYVQNEVGFVATFMGVTIFSTQFIKEETNLKTGIYVGYKDYSDINQFIEDIRSLL